jgi:hypothetical protein
MVKLSYFHRGKMHYAFPPIFRSQPSCSATQTWSRGFPLLQRILRECKRRPFGQMNKCNWQLFN